MRKRITGVLLAAVMAASLTACSGLQTPTAGPVNGGDTTGDNVSQETEDTGDAGQESTADAGTETTDNTNPGETAEEQDGNASAGGVYDMLGEDWWKEVYLEFITTELPGLISEYDDLKTWTYGFIYVNDDYLPELVACSGYEAAGNIVVTIIDGETQYFQTGRLGLQYVPYGNVLCNSDGNMGYYHDFVWTIGDSGFENIAVGFREDEMNENGYTGNVIYTWDDKSVSGEEYESNLDALIPYSKALSFCAGSLYDDMIAFLEGSGPRDYKEAYLDAMKRIRDYEGNTYPAFALIEQNNGDPLLMASNDDSFVFASFSGGILQIGPSWYFPTESDYTYDIIRIFSGLGLVESFTAYTESYNNSYSYYRMMDGSLLADYISSDPIRDENGELTYDADGDYAFRYYRNGREIEKAEYMDFFKQYEEEFFQQLTPYSSEATFIDYVSGDAMEDMLKK